MGAGEAAGLLERAPDLGAILASNLLAAARSGGSPERKQHCQSSRRHPRRCPPCCGGPFPMGSAARGAPQHARAVPLSCPTRSARPSRTRGFLRPPHLAAAARNFRHPGKLGEPSPGLNGCPSCIFCAPGADAAHGCGLCFLFQGLQPPCRLQQRSPSLAGSPSAESHSHALPLCSASC